VNAHTLGPWLEILKDIAIPILAILIPTRIAVRLAETERLAARTARQEDREREERELLERKRQAGGLAAIEAMEELVRAAQEPDAQRRDDAMVRGRTLITTITLSLRARHKPVWFWALGDLNIVAVGVADRDDNDVPRLIEHIQVRSSMFVITMMEWLEGDKTDESFLGRIGEPLSETPLEGFS
jgi:hypothetical protein